MEVRTKELKYLLNNYWCIKEDNIQDYFSIKNNLDYYREFIRDKLGSKLIVNDRFIKLEKIPAVAKAYMGIEAFNDKLEYVLLFLVLLFLEDKPKATQFVLSTLIDFISNTASTIEIDNVPNWNILHHRKCLVNVIKHLSELGIIKVVEEQNFTEEKEAEALYESNGLSNFYVREFKNNILDYECLNDYVNDEFVNQNDNIGDVRRYRVYRHLLYSMFSSSIDLTEAEMDYLKKFRSSINNEIGKYTNSELEITKNMALLMFSSETREKLDFPNAKAICDIVLLVNYKILERIDSGELNLSDKEIVLIPTEQLSRIIKDVREDNFEYLSKFYRDMTVTNFINEVILYMKEYDFIREDEYGYKLLPIVSKLVGYIPKDLEEQLELFGGEENE